MVTHPQSGHREMNVGAPLTGSLSSQSGISAQGMAPPTLRAVSWPNLDTPSQTCREIHLQGHSLQFLWVDIDVKRHSTIAGSRQPIFTAAAGTLGKPYSQMISDLLESQLPHSLEPSEQQAGMCLHRCAPPTWDTLPPIPPQSLYLLSGGLHRVAQEATFTIQKQF